MSNKDFSNPYLFKQVSLLSTSDVRYDGRLYVVDNDANTLALQHVKCMGTEGRRSGDHAIAPSDCVYEFIIFRAENIKKLYVVDDNRYEDTTEEILEPLRSKPSRQSDNQQHNHPSTSTPASRGGKHGTGPASKTGAIRTSRNNEEHAQMAYQRMSGDSNYINYTSQAARTSALQAAEDQQIHGSQHNGYSREATTQMQMHKRKVGLKKQAPYADSRAKYDQGYYNDYGYSGHSNQSSQNYTSRRPQPKSRSYVNYGYSNEGYYDNSDGYGYSGYEYRSNYGAKKAPRDQQTGVRNKDYYPRKAQGYYANNPKSRAPIVQQVPRKAKKLAATRKAPRKQTSAVARAGTGEYLERRQLIGNEIEVPKEDLDLTASLAKLENEPKSQQEEKEANGPKESTENKDQTEKREVKEDTSKQSGGDKPEDTVTITHGKRAYAKDDFFDNLNLDISKKENAKTKTEESVPVKTHATDVENQRKLDVQTFGSVAEQYRFASRQKIAVKNNKNVFNKKQYQYKTTTKNKQYRPQQAQKASQNQNDIKKGQRQEYRSRGIVWQPREQNSKV